MARVAAEKVRAGAWGVLFATSLAFLIVVGSRNLDHFDAALVGYTFATLFATFGVTYRYAMWLQRPPTRLYWRRGWAGDGEADAGRLERPRIPPPFLLRVRGQPVHLSPGPAARAGALADHVGLPARGRHHVPAGLGLDPFRDRSRSA